MSCLLIQRGVCLPEPCRLNLAIAGFKPWSTLLEEPVFPGGWRADAGY
jgi:hypothetical protein